MPGPGPDGCGGPGGPDGRGGPGRMRYARTYIPSALAYSTKRA